MTVVNSRMVYLDARRCCWDMTCNQIISQSHVIIYHTNNFVDSAKRSEESELADITELSATDEWLLEQLIKGNS